MNATQIELARHALGLDATRRVRRSYRNRFYAGGAHPEWDAMVEAGDATRTPMPSSIPDYALFELTRQGADKALKKGESLDPEDFPPVVPA